jgi:hypothetical protein
MTLQHYNSSAYLCRCNAVWDILVCQLFMKGKNTHTTRCLSWRDICNMICKWLIVRWWGLNPGSPKGSGPQTYKMAVAEYWTTMINTYNTCNLNHFEMQNNNLFVSLQTLHNPNHFEMWNSKKVVQVVSVCRPTSELKYHISKQFGLWSICKITNKLIFHISKWFRLWVYVDQYLNWDITFQSGLKCGVFVKNTK